ncbi:hypothetical protein JHK87_024875 [Glycine soja]|nr:hypothetical protein JHK87_024875 [Glycine soja]
MGTNTLNKEELKEIENLIRKDIEEAPIVLEDVSRITPCVIVMKLILTTRLVPNLNVLTTLLEFLFIRAWTKVFAKAKIVSTSFTRQENTITQTWVGIEENNPGSTKEPRIGWMTTFLFMTSFVGLLALVPIRKWFYLGEDNCGFVQFSTFGLKAWKNSYFNFSMTYVKIGMICSHLINLSLLLGVVIL